MADDVKETQKSPVQVPAEVAAERRQIVKHEKSLEKLGAFEIAFQMLKLAKNNEKQNIFLDAGRGNPNWIQTISRLAFARIVEFGVHESEQTMHQRDLAGYTQLMGISVRFRHFLSPEENEVDQFLLDALNYCEERFGFNSDSFVKELVDGAIGNDYPVPSRVLAHTETILNAYLASTLYHHVDGTKLALKTQVFPTEGGTAAIAYIFNSLKENKLIHRGDRVIINTPIFTPYLSIPQLNDYELQRINLNSREEDHWQLAPEAIGKLNDSNVKVLMLVNPSNPGAMALSSQSLDAIKAAVTKNPDLMIITDDVYGTFAEQFESVYAVVPNNTLLVYSYSKLFGATGWRIGVIAAHEDNVFDRLIAKLPDNQKAELDKRYGHIALHPENMKFIDRMVADSRSIGLYHTAGLSTPQQIMEVLFSLAHLLNESVDGADQDHYIAEAKSIVDTRYQLLNKGLGINGFNSPHNTKYYSLIDIYELARQYYGTEFANWLRDNFTQLDFLYKLSKRYGTVLMNGVGFGSKPGILRVSEANLPDEAYSMIASDIRGLMASYHTRWMKEVPHQA
ncbi:MAG: bifunctional aspartate transaminase/aspartate 4-decarboxylase [Aeriscardovia sp.]|nr:bifunctional aspartate transaminase/aspartate 4-decarboxylase [Aeriscardovia sp.]